MVYDIAIRPLSPADFLMMTKWLRTEEVLHYYESDAQELYTYESIIEKYSPRLNGVIDIPSFIVEVDTDPIGFVQSYRVTDEEIEAWGLPKGKTYFTFDQFIGDPDLWGQGIGSQMIKRFVVELLTKHQPDGVIVTPNVTNERAIKCYEKCGFRKVNKIENDLKWMLVYGNSIAFQ